ncbi:MAG: hypothetical protein WKF75_04355, partial [Singulisphaera sp.]
IARNPVRAGHATGVPRDDSRAGPLDGRLQSDRDSGSEIARAPAIEDDATWPKPLPPLPACSTWRRSTTSPPSRTTHAAGRSSTASPTPSGSSSAAWNIPGLHGGLASPDAAGRRPGGVRSMEVRPTADRPTSCAGPSNGAMAGLLMPRCKGYAVPRRPVTIDDIGRAIDSRMAIPPSRPRSTGPARGRWRSKLASQAFLAEGQVFPVR